MATAPSAITEWIADFPVVGGRFGLFLPKDIPAEANDRITEAFIEATQSEAMINFAQERALRLSACMETRQLRCWKTVPV